MQRYRKTTIKRGELREDHFDLFNSQNARVGRIKRRNDLLDKQHGTDIVYDEEIKYMARKFDNEGCPVVFYASCVNENYTVNKIELRVFVSI